MFLSEPSTRCTSMRKVDTTDNIGQTQSGTLADLVISSGYDYAVGVPDSILKNFLGPLELVIPVLNVPREDVAVAFATGISLAESKPIVFMKNAGLFTCADALTSLALDIGEYLTLIVGWAGTGSDKLSHHLVTGSRTIDYLNVLGVSWAVWDKADIHSLKTFLTQKAQGHRVLLVPPGSDI